MTMNSNIIVALDYPSADSALKFCEQISPDLCAVKVGKELFTAAGPQFVEILVGHGFKVFLDLKYHDIPNTVAKACSAAAKLGVWMLNVHALGGAKMLQAAREAIDAQSGNKPLLIGVTLLTSLSETESHVIGLSGKLDNNVMRLAGLCHQEGLEGVVCSAHEATALKKRYREDFCLVTPGIRLQGSSQDDQTRIMTPERAITAGSDYLVIGRPITQAKSPMDVLLALQNK